VTATATPHQAVLQQYGRLLKLPAVVREYPALCRQAEKDGWPYQDFLKELLEAEVRSRHEKAIAHRLKDARFPDIKTLEQIDWEAIQGVSRPKLLELSRGEWIDRHEDLCLAGPIGTGKTHLAIALGVEAARRRGWSAHLLTTYLEGEARTAGRLVAGLAHGVAHGQSSFTRPVCLILGGETTVTLRGNGRGGRNQELALAAAIALEEYGAGPDPSGVAVVSLATDGNDGPTAAAGGIVTPGACARGRALGLDAQASLDANDSYTYLAALESLVVTGPTNTNVNDLTFVFCL